MRVQGVSIKRRRSAAAAVEMAAVLPLFIALILGQIESSRMGMVKELLTLAARQGCREAVLNNATLSDVQSQINSVMATSGISLSELQVVDNDPGTAGSYVMPSKWNSTSLSAGTDITVTLRVNYSDVSWVPIPRFVGGNATVTAKAILSAERAS